MKPKSRFALVTSTANRQSPLSLAVVVSALLSSQVYAQKTWDGGGMNTNWTNGDNWSTNVAPVAGEVLTFAGTVQATNTNDLAADTTFGGFSFTNTGNGQSFNLSGNRITLGGSITTTLVTAGSLIADTIALDMVLSGNRTVTTALRHDLRISGAISEDAPGRTFTKSGTGLLILEGNNSNTGDITVNNGTLRLNRSGGTIADSAKLRATTDTAILEVAQSDTVAILELAAAATVSGAGTLTVSNAIIPNIALNKTNTIGASLAGDAYLRKTGQGTTILSAANSYTGGTIVRGTNSKLTISGSGTLGSTSGALSVEHGTAILNLGGTSQTVGSVSSIGSVTNGTLNVTAQLSAGVSNIIPADAPATLIPIGTGTFNNLNMGTGSIFNWDIDAAVAQTAGTGYDNIVAASFGGPDAAVFNVVLQGSDTFNSTFWAITRTWDNIISTDGTAGGALNLANVFSGFTYNGSATAPSTGAFAFTDGGTSLTWTAVPEPTSALAGLLLGAGLLRRRRA